MIPIRMSDCEWAFLAPFVSQVGPKSGRRPRDHRATMDGILWIAHRGFPWRSMHSDFGKWDSIYRQFRRWTASGVWEAISSELKRDPLEDCDGLSADPFSHSLIRENELSGLKWKISRVRQMI